MYGRSYIIRRCDLGRDVTNNSSMKVFSSSSDASALGISTEERKNSSYKSCAFFFKTMLSRNKQIALDDIHKK